MPSFTSGAAPSGHYIVADLRVIGPRHDGRALVGKTLTSYT
jgi:hypothetical protein